ncbi:GNAT family N-acetyltransferase [Paenibacillus terrigena]|uniref:GNAT family N-acetyltransferase n=1 Tax=Paenibacillus terrigena TaxID=369333 RepID=UPI0028D23C31|nr:GNAT family N-acetyltransferase [Paenibacillus terrigena]
MYSEQMNHGKECTRGEFTKATALFENLRHHISIYGVIQGTLSGRVFMSQDGASALLTSPQGMFLGGRPDNHLFFQEINGLLREELLSNLAATGKLDYVLFYPSDELWAETLLVVMKDLLPLRSGRMTFSHDLQGIEDTLADQIYSVNRDIFERQELIGLDGVIDEIQGGWPSIEAFLESGFGCVAIQHTEQGPAIISWCLTDWVVGDVCEIGIETHGDYRGQGWAHKTAAGALLLAKQHGLTRVGWQCWSNNVGSQRTAQSVGFKLLADFPVLFGWNKPLNNLLVNGNHYMRGDMEYGVAQDYARAAWSYAEALDQGWDWGGDTALYWNAACMFYRTGNQERAKQYYKQAIDLGWQGIHHPHYHDHIYREADSEEIAQSLTEACKMTTT